MTKRRTPLTFSSAIAKIGAYLGYDVAGAACGRSDRSVYAWADPKEECLPTLGQALALERAYRAAGGEGSPILEAFGHQLDLAVLEQSSERTALAGDYARLARECGEAIATGIAVAQFGSGDREVHAALTEAEHVHTAIGSAIRRLKKFLPNGAGLLGGKTGGVPTA
ncbi:MAG: hypothetical protein WCS75_01420 [Sphingomonas sp.]|jgi:hypothetical protein|uniref:hypothetical protein n=1 Tax=Sphingomonas sp. TaxID=28214 RepID=UPI00356AA11E